MCDFIWNFSQFVVSQVDSRQWTNGRIVDEQLEQLARFCVTQLGTTAIEPNGAISRNRATARIEIIQRRAVDLAIDTK